MGKSKTRHDYDERSAALFNNRPKPVADGRGRSVSVDSTVTDDGGQHHDARPFPSAVVSAVLLTGTCVVHQLLNLREIKEPDRWLRRHGAPVAMVTGGSKRYLAGDVLRWAAERFGTTDASKDALRRIAARLEASTSACAISSNTSSARSE